MDLLYYPHVNRKDVKKNPFNYRFLDGLKKSGVSVESVRENTGVVDLFLKFTKTNCFFFNFIENLPERKFGVIQSIFFILFILIAKAFKKRILWCAHNNISHSKNKFFFKKLLFRLIAASSDKILVLSNCGKTLLKPFVSNHKKIYVINLPTENFDINPDKTKIGPDIDFLIWGEIFPYKGVSKFMKFYETSNYFNNKKIYIVGKIKDKNLLNSKTFRNKKNLLIRNEFIDEKELVNLHLRSKYIFFSYEYDSTIASSALNFSLSLKSNILASNVGQFSDMGQKGLVLTYNNFEDIEKILNSNTELNIKEISKYIEENSWEKFILTFKNIFLKDD